MKSLAIITGASGGLGRAFTKYLMGEVDEVWAIGRNGEKLTGLTEAFGAKIKGYCVDLSAISNLETIRCAVDAGEFAVKYLVNAAGAGRMARSTDFSAGEIESHINTHATSMAVLCNLCIPHMQRGSHIINVASQAAFQPAAYINLYAASKAFCYSYSRALNLELKPRGIAVTAACPGWIRTGLLPTEINGHAIQFPHIAEPDDVARKTIRDAKKGKDISVYSAYVRMMRFFSTHCPHKWIMYVWLRAIQKYIS